MKKETETIELARIIVRSMREKLTGPEQQQLDAWLEADAAHRERYKAFCDTAFLKDRTARHKEIDWQSGYRHFRTVRSGRRKRLFLRRTARYAAVLLLLLSASVAGYLWWPVAAPPEQKFVPGQGKALLTLAAGEQITLGDTTSIRLKTPEGTHIRIGNKQIGYSPDGSGKDETPQYHTLQTSRGGEYRMTLSDGTKVWLNADTKMRYPVRFSGNERRVFVEGEVFLDVRRDTARPFVLVSEHGEVTVLGTRFNFRSYPEETEAVTTLESGCVRMASGKNGGTIRLMPGEQGRLDKKAGTLVKKEVDTYLYTAWQKGRIVCRNARLETLFNTLARWYDLQIVYADPAAKDIRFTCDIDKCERFEKILEIIESNRRVRFTTDHRTITVHLPEK